MMHNDAFRGLCTVWDDFFYEGPIDPDPDDDDGFVDGGVDDDEETEEEEEGDGFRDGGGVDETSEVCDNEEDYEEMD